MIAARRRERDGYAAATEAATFLFSYEAHLPAEETQARPLARLPWPNEYTCRPCAAQTPPRQGSQAAHSLSVDSAARTPRRRRPRRLSRSADFERVYRQGRSFSGRFFVLHLFPRGDQAELSEGPRLGLSVSRKVGGAVERNKVKRMLRAAVEQLLGRIDPAADVVVVARESAGELVERDGLEGVTRELDELISQAAKQAGQ